MGILGKRIKTRYAESLSEIYQHIQSIRNETQRDTEDRPMMWFRGHAKSSFHLEPNIFRGADYQYNSTKSYSNNHLREEYRFQSFMSRNYDSMSYHMPQYVIEWQEVMQHFFTKTRLMDWSESLTVALEFALESFITPVKDLEIEQRCRTADPAIWILQPTKLNKEVYKAFSNGNRELIYNALGEKSNFAKKLAEDIMKELAKEEKNGIYYNIKETQEKNMNAMIGLSSLEIIRDAYKGRELEALRNFEMNPFFFLLLRYYSDGIPVKLGEIPPLAIIHPYHSERIKMQKGVFTVFPYYIPDKKMDVVKKHTASYPAMGMEYMPKCIPCLHCIRILNPQKVAEELMITGAKRGNLYPDMQIISQDMENAIN